MKYTYEVWISPKLDGGWQWTIAITREGERDFVQAAHGKCRWKRSACKRVERWIADHKAQAIAWERKQEEYAALYEAEKEHWTQT
jgi:hypothetical protein